MRVTKYGTAVNTDPLVHLSDNQSISQRADRNYKSVGHPVDGDQKYYTEEESIFLKACQEYQARLSMRFLKATDYLYILTKILDYRKETECH